MSRSSLALIAISVPAAPALAHSGWHSDLEWLTIVQHLTAPDHLALLALAATLIAGCLGQHRRAEARARLAARHPGGARQ